MLTPSVTREKQHPQSFKGAGGGEKEEGIPTEGAGR